MGLSTERKVFLGVLAVAGVALVVDQGFLGPSEASATPGVMPEPVEAELAQPATQAASAASTTTMAKVLMERLQGMNGEKPEQSLSAAFSLQDLMENPERLVISDDQQDAPIRPSLPMIMPTADDLPSLSAVMPSTNGKGGALLNGKLVRVGETSPSGFVLREVRERSVVLWREGRIFTVEMPMQAKP